MFWFLMLFWTFDVLFLTFDEVIFDVLTISHIKKTNIIQVADSDFNFCFLKFEMTQPQKMVALINKTFSEEKE